MPQDEMAKLLELADKSIEGSIADEERDQLESICSNSPMALRLYVDYCALHANLRLNRGESCLVPTLLSLDVSDEPLSPKPPINRSRALWVPLRLLGCFCLAWVGL